MRIVFMGTPDFAVPCLEKILADGHEVPAVFTQPDKPVGRHATLTPPPVKQLALSHGIPVYQPTKMRDGTVAAQLQALAPDCLVVVAYGRILPQAILDVPPKGCINIHGSLLPKYRGAAPIQWSVINGEAVTGVTSMYMDAGMDTGDLIDTITTPIGENETAGELLNGWRRWVPSCSAAPCTPSKTARRSAPRRITAGPPWPPCWKRAWAGWISPAPPGSCITGSAA